MFRDSVTVLLPSRQPEKLTAFYRDTMKLPCAPGPSPGGPAQNLFAAGESGWIRVEKAGAPLPDGPTALWLEAWYVDDAYAVLRGENHAPLLVDLTDTYYGAREFQVLDPDGNITCVINYARDLPQRRAERGSGLYAGEFRAVLYVKNLDACRRFYTQVLGLASVYQWEENRGDRGFKYQVRPHGSAYIETLFREPLAVQRQGALALRAEDLALCYQTVCARAPGAIAIPLGADAAGSPGFALRDPDGNLVLIWGNP